MCGHSKTSMTNKPLSLQARSKTKTSEKPRKMRAAKQMSNDPNMSCRVFCNMCDKLYILSGLRKHVAKKHSITFTEYKRRHGDPKRQIINMVYHSCRLCKKRVILDTEELSKHLKVHKLGYTQYMKEHMEKGSGLIRPRSVSSSPPVSPQPRTQFPTVPSLPPTPPPSPPLTIPSIKKEPQETLSYFPVKEEPVEVISPSMVIIQCHQCFRVFKQNKQLLVHMKKNHPTF